MHAGSIHAPITPVVGAVREPPLPILQPLSATAAGQWNDNPCGGGHAECVQVVAMARARQDSANDRAIIGV